MSQFSLAEHGCFTNWGDRKPAAVVYVVVNYTCDKTNSSPYENKFSSFPEEE